MKIEVPYQIGDEIQINGKVEVVRGIHIYVTQNSEVVKWRIHIGSGKFVNIDNIESQESKRYGKKKNYGRRGRAR